MRSTKISLLGEGNQFAGRTYIGRVSFEDRSMVVPAYLDPSIKHTFFVSSSPSEMAVRNLRQLEARLPDLQIVNLNRDHPIEIALQMFDVAHDLSESGRLENAVVDITSFRREELLILMGVLTNFLERDSSLEIYYISAGRMATDWMTRNVEQHRSVIGYSGHMRPSLPTRLVLLMGFEVERAWSIIENYEPSQILVGVGREADSISPQLRERNLHFVDELSRQLEAVSSQFEFSPRDPLNVVSELDRLLSNELSDYNVVIAPLHTKLSTLGAGLYSLINPDVQICYASVSEYNMEAYSTVGELVFFGRLGELLYGPPDPDN